MRGRCRVSWKRKGKGLVVMTTVSLLGEGHNSNAKVRMNSFHFEMFSVKKKKNLSIKNHLYLNCCETNTRANPPRIREK